jgi:membrane fusion protein (multidrug efflux system)
MTKRFQMCLSVLMAVFIASCPAAAQGPAGKAPVPVIVGTVQELPFEDRVEALGTLRASESVVLMSTVTEKVTAINFSDGARVEKGDILLEMTRAEEKSELDAERATVDEARQQLDRIEPLVKAGAAPKSTLDQRKREYETAKARLQGVQSRIGDRIIEAPFSGVLGLRSVSVGTVLQPGTRITTLDDDSVMKLDFSVPSVFLSTLRPGLAITATSRAFEGRAFTGTISSIESQIDPVTRAIGVRALIPNDDRSLRPGLLMSVEILKNPRRAIMVPEEAIIPEGRKNSVFVVTQQGDKATVRKRAVTLGGRRPGQVEVTAGLAAGETIVTQGTLRVSDGSAVDVKKEGDVFKPGVKAEGG